MSKLIPYYAKEIRVSLKRYIEAVGDTVAAELFNVEQRTVSAWRRGERLPRTNKAKEIIKATKGRLKMDDIYNDPGRE